MGGLGGSASSPHSEDRGTMDLRRSNPYPQFGIWNLFLCRARHFSVGAARGSQYVHLGLRGIRSAVGLSAAAGGIFCLSGPFNGSLEKWLLGLVLIVSGTALTAAFLTPIA